MHEKEEKEDMVKSENREKNKIKNEDHCTLKQSSLQEIKWRRKSENEKEGFDHRSGNNTKRR